MSTDAASRAVDEYLRGLDAATAALDDERRAELAADIREHIEASVGPDADEARVREVLARLGPPEEIARAELEASPPPPGGPVLEVCALVVLLVGSLLPLIGWVTGAVLALLSSRWTARQKALAVLLPPLPGLWIAGASFVDVGMTCTRTTDSLGNASEFCTGATPVRALPWLLVPLAVVALAAAAYLLREARRRPPTRAASPGGVGTLVAVAALPAVLPLVGSLAAFALVLSGTWPRRRRRAAAGVLLVGLLLNPVLLLSLPGFGLGLGLIPVGGGELLLLHVAAMLTGPLAVGVLAVGRQRA